MFQIGFYLRSEARAVKMSFPNQACEVFRASGGVMLGDLQEFLAMSEPIAFGKQPRRSSQLLPRNALLLIPCFGREGCVLADTQAQETRFAIAVHAKMRGLDILFSPHVRNCIGIRRTKKSQAFGIRQKTGEGHILTEFGARLRFVQEFFT